MGLYLGGVWVLLYYKDPCLPFPTKYQGASIEIWARGPGGLGFWVQRLKALVLDGSGFWV